MANLKLSYQFQHKLEVEFSEACDNLFIHSGIDSTHDERTQAENRYNKARKALTDNGLDHNESYIMPEFRK